MRICVLLASVVVTLAAFEPATAQLPGSVTPDAGGVPTVTIINKAPGVTERSEVPALSVTPQAPESPAAAASPTAPGVPQAPSAAANPAAATSPTAAASATAPEIPAAPQVPGTAAASEPAPGLDAQASAAADAPAVMPAPEPTLGIDIDLTRQVMNISENGEPLYSWPISSARYGYRTPTGTFQPTWMSKMWYSRQYDYAPMPHAIFFHQGVAIHATYATRALGSPASHGCVRLAPKNAAALYRMVTSHGKANTQIVVHGNPDHSRARMAEGDAYPGSTMRVRRAPRYLPPSYYGRSATAYAQPPAYYYAPRGRRQYAQPRRQPRGLFNGNSYGYGF